MAGWVNLLTDRYLCILLDCASSPMDVFQECNTYSVIPDILSVSYAYKNQSKSIICPPSSHCICRGSKTGPITLKVELSGVR